MPVSQQNEQLLNANWVKKILPNQTIIIHQSKLTPKRIFDSIAKLEKIRTNTINKPKESNKKLLDLIYETI